MVLFEKASNLAIKAHQGSTRKFCKTPYILHPFEVASIASRMTDSEEVLCAALLHDVVEDANVSLDYIKEEFTPYIATLVESETENKRKNIPSSETWKIRKQESIDSLSKVDDKGIKILWLSDKLSNMRSIAYDYSKIGDEIWQRFNQKDKKEHKWYYESVLKCVSELECYPAYREYESLIKYVFADKEV